MNRPPHGRESGDTNRGSLLLRVALILGAGFWAFSPALHGGWIWDDHFIIEQNPLIHNPRGLWTAWFFPKTFLDCYPLKITVEWLEWRLWHDNTLGYHVTTILLHLCGCLLLWRLLHRLGLKWAWLGGLIFAIHPVNVESVAWVAELKNTLSLPPFLLAMCAYIDYDETGRKKDYYLALSLFLVAMLCKTSMATFPLVILLYAWWKRGHISRVDLKNSALFFVVSLALGLATLLFVHFTIEGPHPSTGSLLSRLACAGLIATSYFASCVFPVQQMPCDPRWVVDPPTLIQFLPYPAWIGILLWSWINRATWGRHVLLGLGFFLITVAPFAWLVPMNFTWTMDHLIYIPLIGIIGLAVAGWEKIEQVIPNSLRPIGVGVLTAAIALMSWRSHSYSAIFADEETFWAYAVESNPGAWMAHNNLGATLAEKGDMPAAIEQYSLSVQIFPCPTGYNNLGIALMQADRLPQAISAFATSLQLNPYYTVSYDRMGFALMEAGRVDDAKKQFEAALKIDPKDVYAKRYLGQIELTEKATLPGQ